MLLAVHVACYIASSTLMGQQKKFIIDMDLAGDGLHYTHRVLVAARTIADKYFPGLPAVTNAAADATRPWGLDPVSTFVEQLGVAATRTREAHYGVYLGFETLRRLDNGARPARLRPPRQLRWRRSSSDILFCVLKQRAPPPLRHRRRLPAEGHVGEGDALNVEARAHRERHPHAGFDRRHALGAGQPVHNLGLPGAARVWDASSLSADLRRETRCCRPLPPPAAVEPPPPAARC